MSALEVILRLRPSKSETVGLYKKDSRTVVLKNKSGNKEEYKFERVYDGCDNQELIYAENVAHLINRVLDGVNVSVLAYGPTGTGKTFTIEGENSTGNAGIIPRAALELCKKIRQRASDETQLLSISCMEVYNEKIIDLLNEDAKPDLRLFEDPDKLIEVEGLTKLPLKSFQDFKDVFTLAKKRRTVGATAMNEKSSRSHAVWRFRVNRKIGTGEDAIDREAKIDFVDLAGSEDNRRTQSTSESMRFKESTKINLSLTVLKRVIKAVAAKSKNVPIRDSKLTRLLKDAFGGNSHSVLILNVAPEEENLRDSAASLDFSTVAKQIVSTPFEGLSAMVTPKKSSRMPLEENKTPTSPFAGRTRQMNDSIERYHKQVLIMKEENRQKAAEQRNLLKEMKAAEKENDAKLARAAREQSPAEPAPKLVKQTPKFQELIDYLNAGDNLVILEGVGPKIAQKIRECRPIKDYKHFEEIFGKTRAKKAAVCFKPQ